MLFRSSYIGIYSLFFNIFVWLAITTPHNLAKQGITKPKHFFCHLLPFWIHASPSTLFFLQQKRAATNFLETLSEDPSSLMCFQTRLDDDIALVVQQKLLSTVNNRFGVEILVGVNFSELLLYGNLILHPTSLVIWSYNHQHFDIITNRNIIQAFLQLQVELLPILTIIYFFI